MVKMLRTVALVLDVGASQTAIQLFHHLESKCRFVSLHWLNLGTLKG